MSVTLGGEGSTSDGDSDDEYFLCDSDDQSGNVLCSSSFDIEIEEKLKKKVPFNRESTEMLWKELELPCQAVRRACLDGNLAKLKELFSGIYTKGVNQFFFGHSDNPLIAAAGKGHVDIVVYLLDQKKANPNLTFPNQKVTALLSLVQSLPSSDQWSSCSSAEETLVKGIISLVKAGANVNSQDNEGLSALMHATRRSYYLIVKYLLENGANPNLADRNLDTALIFAAANGEGRLCRLLLEHGADSDMMNVEKFTAADMARENCHFEISEFLFDARDTMWKPGLNPNLKLVKCKQGEKEREQEILERYSVKEFSALEKTLKFAGGARYAKNFEKHKVTYALLLKLNDEKLKEVGVDDKKVRNNLMRHIALMKRSLWDQGTIRAVAENSNVTLPEVVCILIDLEYHLENVNYNVEYFSEKMSSKRRALRFCRESNSIEDLVKSGKILEERLLQLSKKIAAFHRLLRWHLKWYFELKSAGMIPQDLEFNEFVRQMERFRNIAYRVGGVGAVVSGGALFCMLISNGWLKRLAGLFYG